METKEGVAAALLAALQDRRVNVLCLKKSDGRDARDAIMAIKDAVLDVQFDYWDKSESDQRNDKYVEAVTSEILEATDGRSVRGLLSTIYEISRAKGLFPRNIARNGFFYYLRALGQEDLRVFIESSGLHGGVRVGPFQQIGEGSQKVIFLDNMGSLIARDGLENWLARRYTASGQRDRPRMLVMAGDFDFPNEIIGLGNWGYTVNLIDDSALGNIERFSPVDLKWDVNTLAAQNRTGSQDFTPAVSPETLSTAYEALASLGQTIANRIPYEQVDQRIAESFSIYADEARKPEPNVILLDCYFDLCVAQISQEEGASGKLEALYSALSKRHRAAVSSSPICRDLDRAARLVDPSESIPQRLLDNFVDDLDVAEREQVVDHSVRLAAGEIIDLEKEREEGAKKKQLAFSGFVKAIWSAFEKAPDAVKGVDAFRRLFAMAEQLKEFLSAHGMHWPQ